MRQPNGHSLRPSKTFESKCRISYGAHRVRGAILDYLRGLDPMTRKMRGASRQITVTIKAFTARVGGRGSDTAPDITAQRHELADRIAAVCQERLQLILFLDAGPEHQPGEAKRPDAHHHLPLMR